MRRVWRKSIYSYTLSVSFHWHWTVSNSKDDDDDEKKKYYDDASSSSDMTSKCCVLQSSCETCPKHSDLNGAFDSHVLLSKDKALLAANYPTNNRMAHWRDASTVFCISVCIVWPSFHSKVWKKYSHRSSLFTVTVAKHSSSWLQNQRRQMEVPVPKKSISTGTIRQAFSVLGTHRAKFGAF